MSNGSDADSGVFDLLGEDDDISPEDRAHVIAGRYQIVDHIASGGMGQVLLVRHRRLGKSFALKLMTAEMSLSEDAREMFDREARLASSISHPNVVSVVDFGEDPDWGLFLVMEYIEGQPLSERMEAIPRVPIEAACQVVEQMAAALGEVHAAGIVHGDLKPQNVLCVGREDDDADDWHVKLLDFGVARHVAANAGAEDTVEGTPEYIAPERVDGTPPSPANDIYSLGVVLFELLAGSTPFSGDVQTVLTEKLTKTPDLVGARRGEVLDERLEAIVARTIAVDPGDRFATMAELGAELRAYMDEIGMRHREVQRRLQPRPEDAAAAAFAALAVPSAGIAADGTIIVANQALARVMQSDDPRELEGRSVMTTILATLLPTLREDLRLVAMLGKEVRRRVVIERSGKVSSTLRLALSPAAGVCGSCVMTLYALPSAPEADDG